ncbi:alpha/beta hydrolase [Massilia sp. H-1]|nr:alpha/beta hydrolase [Massilia sp. H-1]
MLLSSAATAAPMTLQDYLALSGPAPTATIAYGSAPSQFAELFRPAGPGPFPVVVLIHGGCWTVEFGGITQMHNVVAPWPWPRGIAVWNVEYRRADEEGGGYPGTYLDINAALDKLAAEAPRHQLDTSRIVAVGHSVGGQLAQWIVGRGRIPASSPLYQAHPLPVRQVISLGGLADLRNEKDLIKTSCGRDLSQLVSSASATRPDVFADTNAAELVPNGSTTLLITGELDTISPPRAAHDFAAPRMPCRDRAEVLILPNASHYDEIAASSCRPGNWSSPPSKKRWDWANRRGRSALPLRCCNEACSLHRDLVLY